MEDRETLDRLATARRAAYESAPRDSNHHIEAAMVAAVVREMDAGGASPSVEADSPLLEERVAELTKRMDRVEAALVEVTEALSALVAQVSTPDTHKEPEDGAESGSGARPAPGDELQDLES